MSNFLRSKGISFASVDIRGDRDVMMTAWPRFFIPPKFHVDIQDLFRVDGVVRTGMAVLADALISNFYLRMKNDFPKERHECWEESPLEEINLDRKSVV